MVKYVIKDWAGNLLFGGMEFDQFDDGWDYLFQLDLPEDDYQEYFVVPK